MFLYGVAGWSPRVVGAGCVFLCYLLFVYGTIATRGIVAKTRRVSHLLPVLGKGHITLIMGRASGMKRARLLSALLTTRVRVGGMFTPRRKFQNSTSTKRAVEGKGSAHAKVPVLSLCNGGGGPATARLRSVSLVIFSVRSMNTHFCACVDAVRCMVRTYTRGQGRLIVASQPGPYSCISNPIQRGGRGDFINVRTVPVLRNYAMNRLTRVVGNRN